MQSIETLEPNMLLSFINMKLRNNYSSLEELCEDLDISKNVLLYKLQTIGYKYHSEKNQFIVK